jgi:hypothetical protein
MRCAFSVLFAQLSMATYGMKALLLVPRQLLTNFL